MAATVRERRGTAARRVQEATAYKESLVARATGEASRFSQLLTEYRKAPEVTRERLYIETLEEILRNSSKVLVDTEGGNNLLYLPLDQLIQQCGSRTNSSTGSGMPLTATPRTAPTSTPQPRASR